MFVEIAKEKITGNCVTNDCGCWIWQGRASKGLGYGTALITLSPKVYKYISAHRASYMAFKGEIPDGMYVCHTCDVPLCVNPEHLYAGTPKQNQADSFARKRAHRARGESSAISKLTDDIVREIRVMGGTNKDIAAKFSVDPSTVSVIRSRKTWKHV